MNTRLVVAFSLLGILLMPIALPGAVAWRADGWLSQDVVGGERLRHGDEFGCHGMPGKNVNTDLSVISECKDYLTSQINASKWGSEPLSFGLPDGVIESEKMDALMDEGFLIVGGNELQPQNNSSDTLEIIEQSGGSLEKNIASVDAIQTGINEHGYANLYWEAQIEDLNVRRDKDVLEWIESQNYWFTTWGEFHSAGERAAERIDNPPEWDERHMYLIGSAPSEGFWPVPGTTNLTIFDENNAIQGINRVDGLPFPELDTSDHHLQVGYRVTNSDKTIYLTIPEGVEVRITFISPPDDALIRGDHFNGMTPFMVTGHHTTDLFEWSSPFQDSPLRFTWLIEPQEDIEPSWILLAVALLTILAVPAAVWFTLKKERERQNPEMED
ncbi:MAG: hypothetical protein VX627_03000 [Candidatus Thermoplasmatota archaeon]|nr:hypothetical protein [Candidatus Thermoplasmatota archaeon]